MSHIMNFALLDAANKMERAASRLRFQAKQYENQPTWPMQFSTLFREIQADDTPQAVMVKLGCSVSVAELAIEHAQKRLRMKQRAERNELIVRFASRGWTNRQIAARVGLHHSTISKIVRRYMRSGAVGKDHLLAEKIKAAGAVKMELRADHRNAAKVSTAAATSRKYGKTG